MVVVVAVDIISRSGRGMDFETIAEAMVTLVVTMISLCHLLVCLSIYRIIFYHSKILPRFISHRFHPQEI